jgi:hypothetical protein
MKKKTIVLAAVLMAVGTLPRLAATEVEGGGAGDPAAALRAAVAQACLAATAVDGGEAGGGEAAGGRAAGEASAASGLSGSISRRVLAGDVAEYSFLVRVGPGPHDVFGLHRVVREVAPFVPVHAGRGLMMAHGDAWGFDAAFLSGLASPSPAALPVFLAQNGIDVWGIDFRWSLVGSTTTDFSFMKRWGMATDAGDLAVALAAARLTRKLTGDGAAPLNLLGWSRGGQTSYVYVNAETRMPPQLRQVGGLIVVESFLLGFDPAVYDAYGVEDGRVGSAPPDAQPLFWQDLVVEGLEIEGGRAAALAVPSCCLRAFAQLADLQLAHLVGCRAWPGQAM